MGRKPGISVSERLLRAEIARALSLAVGSKRGAMSKAAIDLEVTKQAFSLYMRQRATPGAEVLRRICKLWNLQLNVQGALVDAEKTPHRSPAKEPEQLSLFAAIAEMVDRKLDVRVLSKNDRSIDLKVSINFD